VETRLLLWLTLLLTPNLVFTLVSEAPFDALVRSLPPSSALIALLLAWTRQPSWVLLILSPFYFFIPFEIFYISQFKHPSTPHILAVIGESNPTEAIEYLGKELLISCITVGIVLFLTTLWIALKAHKLPPSSILRWAAWASLIPVAQYIWIEVNWTRSQVAIDARSSTSLLDSFMTTEPTSPLSLNLSDSYPLGVFFRVRDYLAERSILHLASEQIRHLELHPKRTFNPGTDEVYVLVIGESSNPAHWGINGYMRNTTPKLTNTENLVSFRNAVSPFSATRLAVPVILKGSQDPFTHKAPLNKASIVTLFKQAGFQTFWISNQAPLGVHDSIIALHAYEADETIYTNGTDYTRPGNLDDAILPVFDRLLKKPAQRKFFVIHLLGSHKAYAHRYPTEFDQFTPSQKQNPEDHNPNTITNTYDNTILFTDHVLASLIQNLQSQPKLYAALLYISDHGENIPHDNCTLTGHGNNNEADYRISALVWLSQEYVNINQNILDILRTRIDAPIYSSGAFHALSQLAHIDHPENNPSLSWVSEHFSPTPRWTFGVPDFDLASRIPPCGELKTP
jgi:glucan phosphoethanolaminetransferase (alkaline phosphatase superfamily)